MKNKINFEDKGDLCEGAIPIQTVIIVVSTLILVLVVFLGISAARSQARDAQRVADIGRIQEALKIYNDNHQHYPESGADKKPKDLNRYLASWPITPTPADGVCTREVNEYTYTQMDGGESYVLGFCIGQETNGLAPGYYQLKP